MRTYFLELELLIMLRLLAFSDFPPTGLLLKALICLLRDLRKFSVVQLVNCKIA